MSKRGHGVGSISKWKKNGVDVGYQVRVTLPDGSRKAAYVKTYSEARERLKELRTLKDTGRLIGGPTQSTRRYLESWLEDTIKRKVRATTHDNYSLNVARALPHIGSVRLDKLTAAHLDRCYRQLEERGLSTHSVDQVHRTLRAAFRHAVKTGVVIAPPTSAATPPRNERREMRMLTRDQTEALFDETQADRLHALYLILATGGLRIGEALGLKWDDVDWKAGTLLLRRSLKHAKGRGQYLDDMKTRQSRRTVHLAPVAVTALRHHQDRQGFEKDKAEDFYHDQKLVFCSETGGFLHSSNIHKYLQRHLEAAQLPRIRVHDLRHTAASLLLQQGTHPKMVQELLGHSSIGLTMDTYSHVIPAMHREVADRMEALFGASR